MWSVVAPLLLAASALLAIAGAPKVVDPAPLQRAVRAVGLPINRVAVQAFAIVETLIGAVTLVWPTQIGAGLVALLYAGFTAFVAIAAAKDVAVESCGCFGKADTPPTLAHAVVTGGAAVAAGLAAISVPKTPWAGYGLAELFGTYALAGLVGFLAWQVIAVLPTTTPAAIRSIRKA